MSLEKSLTRIVEQWNPLLSFFKNEVNAEVKTKSSKIPPKKIEGISISTLATEGSSGEAFKPVIKISQDKSVLSARSSAKSVGTSVINLESNHKAHASKRKAEQNAFPNKKRAKEEKRPSFDTSLSRQKRLFMFLSADINNTLFIYKIGFANV